MARVATQPRLPGHHDSAQHQDSSAATRTQAPDAAVLCSTYMVQVMCCRPGIHVGMWWWCGVVWWWCGLDEGLVGGGPFLVNARLRWLLTVATTAPAVPPLLCCVARCCLPADCPQFPDMDFYLGMYSPLGGYSIADTVADAYTRCKRDVARGSTPINSKSHCVSSSKERKESTGGTPASPHIQAPPTPLLPWRRWHIMIGMPCR